MNRLSAEYLARVGLDLRPTTELSRLSTAERQLVEVAKALSTNASVVIMDEPTSSLSVRETDRLFEVVRSLRNDNVSTIYISHRLGEVIELADRVEVLRDGRNAGQLVGDQINYDAMVAAMVGRDVSQLFDREPFKPGATVLQVENLSVETEACPAIDLHVNSGEVVGVAGLVGSGRSELLETIFGIRKPARGRIRINNIHVPLGSTVAAIDAGMALVPEDRKRTGLFTQYSVAENAVVSAITDAPVAPMISRRWIAKVAGDLIKQLGVKTASQNTTIDHLSGGNQQKIALGKWLIDPPKLLMLDEPTRGVDVGAKQEIYELLHQLAGEGMAILFVSSEMDEVISLADRVLVMHDGAISGTLRRDELSEQAIMRLAVGLPPNESSGQTDKKPSSPA